MHGATRRAAKVFLLWAVTTYGLTAGVAGAEPVPVLPAALAKLEAAALGGSVDAPTHNVAGLEALREVSQT